MTKQQKDRISDNLVAARAATTAARSHLGGEESPLFSPPALYVWRHAPTGTSVVGELVVDLGGGPDLIVSRYGTVLGLADDYARGQKVGK